MALDTFSTGFLGGVVQSLFGAPSQFLLGRYFPTVLQSDTEEIFFDRINGSRRIAPFVSPLVEGKIVESQGYTTQSFKPAYVKPKTVFDGNRPFRRAPGEAFGGSMAAGDRFARIVANDLQEHENMIQRRLEVMAGEIMATGQVTITGDKYPTQVVSFGRDSSLAVTLSGGARWNQAGTDPIADLETWNGNLLTLAGVVATDVIMDITAWKIFRNNAAVLSYINRFQTNGVTLRPDAMIGEGGVAMGAIPPFNFFVYQGLYYDDVSSTTKQILPSNTVVMASPAMEGYQIYGAIRDEAAGFRAQPRFPKSWVEEDPPVRYIMTQSAPLLVPFRPNASVSATIA